MKDAVGDGTPRAQFNVSTHDLLAYTDQLGRAAEHAAKARDYLHRNDRVDAGKSGEWFSKVEKTHEKVAKHVEDMLGELNKVLARTAGTLSDTADHYQRSDDSARDDLAAEDAKLPRVDR
ncbi:MAG TPA: hypothetical protein VGN37_00590 [Actinocatenispora sp.]